MFTQNSMPSPGTMGDGSLQPNPKRTKMKVPKQDIVRRLRKKAMKSSCRTKVAAIGFSSHGEPLACEFNRPRFSKHGGGIHAEMAVMNNAPANLSLIVLVSVTKTGKLRRIRPCSACARKAMELGVRIVSMG